MNTMETDMLNKRAEMIAEKIFKILRSEFDSITVWEILWNTNIGGEIKNAVVKDWQIKDAEQNKDAIIEKVKELLK